MKWIPEPGPGARNGTEPRAPSPGRLHPAREDRKGPLPPGRVWLPKLAVPECGEDTMVAGSTTPPPKSYRIENRGSEKDTSKRMEIV